MRYVGDGTRLQVTVEVPFIDEPVTLISLNDLPMGTAIMMNQGRIDEAFDSVLDDDLAHILLYQATESQIGEFFDKWKAASDEKHEMMHHADDTLAKILRSFGG